MHTVAVHAEGVAALLVLERVKEHGHGVVAAGLIAIGAVRANDRRVAVVRVDADVELLAVVGDVDVGRLGGRRSLDRPLLREFGDLRGGRPDRVIEAAIHLGRRVDAHRRD